jgi:uncharacterized protein (TIGR04255 family)
MPTEEIVFKHPPTTEVQLVVGFPNNLEIADQRSRFHKLVKLDFPNVIISEQSKLAYDFADYVLQRQDTTERIEIGMNYFRLTSVQYPGFGKFREVFLSTLDTFSNCYEINSFGMVSMSYKNTLPLEPGRKYKDCFALNISLPESLEAELFAGQGLLVYQNPHGFVTIQLEPARIEALEVRSYTMNLMFTTRSDVSVQFNKSIATGLVDIAHDYLKKFFLGILTKQYLDFLSAR